MSEVKVADIDRSLENFLATYQRLDLGKLQSLRSIYDRNVEFIDPFTRIQGLDDLLRYFESMYRNVISCEFDQQQRIGQEALWALTWKMTYRHPKIAKGKAITLDGCSVLKFNRETGKVLYHRDYFDAGAMLYEKLPLLGSLIRLVKRRMERP